MFNALAIEVLTQIDETTIELWEEAQQDYTLCDSIVESLNLTDNMRIALECRMAALKYHEIGRILERAQSTVFEYLIKMRQRYVAIYG